MSGYTKRGVYILSSFVLAFFSLMFTVPRQPAEAAPVEKIAFARLVGNFEIFTMNSDGSNEVNITNNAASDSAPAWSPDGSKIAFQTNRDGNNEIYTMNVDGSNPVNLTNDAGSDIFPSWSPDGTKIVFTSSRDGNNEIYSMNANGSNQVNLSNDAGSDTSPRWSPDGSKIAFSTGRDGNNEIYTMNANGSSPTNLSNNAASEGGPAWSPDGSKIAFSTDRDGNIEIYSMNTDGSNQVNLSNNASLENSPYYSTDGSKIIFFSLRDGNQEIYTMNTDGSNQVRVTNNLVPDLFPTFGIIGDTVVPNNGDANGDGVFDVLQANVTPVVNSVTGEYAVLESSCTSNTSLSIDEESSSSVDAGFDYPVGLMDFTLDCGAPGITASITQYYYGDYDAASLVMRKFNSSGGSYTTIDGATLSNVVIDGDPVLKVVYEITDGSSLDQDGVADGVIVDPSGPGQSVVSAPNTGLGFLGN